MGKLKKEAGGMFPTKPLDGLFHALKSLGVFIFRFSWSSNRLLSSWISGLVFFMGCTLSCKDGDFSRIGLVLIGPLLFFPAEMPYLCVWKSDMKSEISTSGPIDEVFISESDVRTSYEEVPGRGFNRLVKARRQGRWFMLKGLKPEFQGQAVYLELLKKEYALMVQLDHPNVVKAYAKEENAVLGPCIAMEYVDGVRLDEFLAGKPSATARRKVLDQLADALAYIHSKQILHRDLKSSNILVTRKSRMDVGRGEDFERD